jgi:hypothetical protein
MAVERKTEKAAGSGSDFPILSPEACPKCVGKPCRGIPASRNGTVESLRPVPVLCPFLVKYGPINTPGFGVSGLPVRSSQPVGMPGVRKFGKSGGSLYTKGKAAKAWTLRAKPGTRELQMLLKWDAGRQGGRQRVGLENASEASEPVSDTSPQTQVPQSTRTIVMRLYMQHHPDNTQHNDDSPITFIPYILGIKGRTIKGATDQTGVLIAQIPADAVEGELTINGWTAKIKFGRLPGAGTVEGAKARLANLGLLPDFESGENKAAETESESQDRLTRAVMRFQNRYGITPVTGGLDGATVSKLAEIHES